MEQVKEKIKHIYDLPGTATRSERPDSPERTDAKDDSAPQTHRDESDVRPEMQILDF